MNVKAEDYVYIGMVKTGSAYMHRTLRLIDHVEGKFHERFNPETIHELPLEWANLPVFGTIRNPWTWYSSNWAWFSVDRAESDVRSYLRPGISRSRYIKDLSFEEWVRQDPAIMVSEFHYYYTPGMTMVRMEHMIEDLTRVLEEIRGPLSEQTKEIIRKAPVQNKNPNPPPEWTDELKGLVLQGAWPIFKRYYPEELEKWDII